MSTPLRLALLSLVLALPFSLWAQCNGCEPDESCTVDPAYPTLCPTTAPDATAGEYYQADFTFWMPTTFTDPGSGFSVDLLQLTITGVSGLPFGLVFTPSEPSGVYYPPEGEFGCARVCGTPLGQGVFPVTISVLAHVSASGFELDVPQEFSVLINVLPGSGANTGFSYNPSSGCGSVSVSLQALIDGSPLPTGYAWDFGNGNTSTLALPPAQTYDEPGSYVITLETTIGGFVLNTVTLTGVNGSWCGDIEEPDVPFVGCTGDPDPYFVLTNAAGGTFTSGTLDNTTSGNWSDLGLLLDNAPYSISFYDEDAVTQDDLLGTYNIPANGEGAYFINVAGGTTGSLLITNEIQQLFADTDTVVVYALPDLGLEQDTATGELCVADAGLANYVWLLDGAVVPDASGACYLPSAPGLWQVVGTNGFGCVDTSDAVVVCAAFEIVQNGSVLFVPSGYTSYAWTLNGAPIAGNDPFIFAQGAGLYGVSVDAGNGCTVTDTLVLINVGVEEVASGEGSVAVFPNPSEGTFTVVATGLSAPFVTLDVLDLAGRSIAQRRFAVAAGSIRQPLTLGLAPGVFMVRVTDGSQTRVTPIIVR